MYIQRAIDDAFATAQRDNAFSLHLRHIQDHFIPRSMDATRSHDHFGLLDVQREDVSFLDLKARRSGIFAHCTYPHRSGFASGDRVPPSPDSAIFTFDQAKNVSGPHPPILQAPGKPPPKSHTHYDGRWTFVATRTHDKASTGKMPLKWVKCAQTPLSLPSNTPTVEQRPDHWINRILPDGTWTTAYHTGIPLPCTPRSSRPMATTQYVVDTVKPYFADPKGNVPPNPFDHAEPLRDPPHADSHDLPDDDIARPPPPGDIARPPPPGDMVPDSSRSSHAPRHTTSPPRDGSQASELNPTNLTYPRVSFDANAHIGHFDGTQPVASSYVGPQTSLPF